MELRIKKKKKKGFNNLGIQDHSESKVRPGYRLPPGRH